MAQALSAEEFQRMQAQLLELRTENYRLADELRKNGAELSGLRQRVQTLDRDLAKANKALSKSKKAQEVEALLGETRMLQGKLQSQEDDFRLQNSTLLRELAKLCAQIEGLEEENRRLQEGGGGGSPPRPPRGPPGTPRDPPGLSPAPPGRGPRGRGGSPSPPRRPPPLSPQGAEAEALRSRCQQQLQQLQELQELQARSRRLQHELEAATQVWGAGPHGDPIETLYPPGDPTDVVWGRPRGGLRELSEAQAQELRDSRSQSQRLERELQVCSGERDELRQRLQEAEAAQERLREEQEQQREQLEAELGQLRAALGEEQRLRELHEAEGRALRQELKDVRDGQRILEKKGSAALKDLRRQLQLERRRGERLQERLQELLVPNRARSGLEELGLDGGSPGRGPGGDSSSVSSLGRDGSAPGSTKSGSGSPGGGSGGGVPAGGGLSPAEVAELFQRLAQSQQERWLLEEKVRHLEVSSASMAEDLCRKSAIIQSFVRDSRTEAAGPAGQPRRGAGAGPGEEGLREMNKKLQNLLEEQLTKNLHLAQDLESLSQELAQLRKEQAAPPGPP
ncbi:LOW QUALITY PROTEIN: GRIP1-associated protein 1-like [Chamaea fasciata]|uniref:LOW QUALITY PROTEIN: GRIP1-associated protein 1-like n=1 Tax=Chamaea fasciata TaxID=190680 RepID=UPI00336A8A22